MIDQPLLYPKYSAVLADCRNDIIVKLINGHVQVRDAIYLYHSKLMYLVLVLNCLMIYHYLILFIKHVSLGFCRHENNARKLLFCFGGF